MIFLKFFKAAAVFAVLIFIVAITIFGTLYIQNIWLSIKEALKFEEPQKTCDEQQSLNTAKQCTYLIGGETTGHGSGFLIDENGYLVTNFHVIDFSSDGYVDVWYDGDYHKSRIVGFSQTDDLAVVKVESSSYACRWEDSDNLALAESVYAIGWPGGPSGESTITKGIYSRFTQFSSDSPYMIQTDTPINPGNSGGPLINECGVVGINTSKISWIDVEAPSEGLGYAISSNYAKSIVSNIIDSDDGQPHIPPASNRPISGTGRGNYSAAPSPNQLVPYSYEEVIFWEKRLAQDKEVRQSWKGAFKSDNFSSKKLSRLLMVLDRKIELAEVLWDGYTNSKITLGQSDYYKQEYWNLNSESADLSRELNYEGNINAYQNCVDAWKDLEKKYDKDFSKEKKECNEYLE